MDLEEPVFVDLCRLLQRLPTPRTNEILQRICLAAYFTHREYRDRIPPEVFVIPTYDDTILLRLQKIGTLIPGAMPSLDLLLMNLARCRVDLYLSSTSLDEHLRWRVQAAPKGDFDQLLCSFHKHCCDYMPRREVLLAAWECVTKGSWSVSEFVTTSQQMIKHYYRFPAELFIDPVFVKLIDSNDFLTIIREFRAVSVDDTTQERLAALAIGDWRITAARLLDEGFALGEIALQAIVLNKTIKADRLHEAVTAILKRLQQQRGHTGANLVLSDETWMTILERNDYNFCEWLLRKGQAPDPELQQFLIKKIRESGSAVSVRLIRLYNSHGSRRRK